MVQVAWLFEPKHDVSLSPNEDAIAPAGGDGIVPNEQLLRACVQETRG